MGTKAGTRAPNRPRKGPRLLSLWIFDAPPSGFTACFDAQMSRARAWAGEVPARAVGGGEGGGGGGGG